MKALKLRLALSTLVLFSLIASLPVLTAAQVGQTIAAPTPGQYEAALSAIETKLDARRKELGIPGLSFVIIKDDQIIFMKGLGYKDLEKKIAVTPDTQFEIGSATKAFTGLSVLMAQDAGKLSLDDSPKKYLPYFKMYDPETDSKITIRDLLSHSSGLNRTDLAMMTGRLDRAQLIQVAAQAKPTAKLREKFQYQNIMFAAAGEIVANVEKTTWEKFVPARILKPLGMNNTSMSVAEMKKAKDRSFGYNYNMDTKETTRLPYREIQAVAPAGSINSSARDMAEWVRFVLNGGVVNGKRLVSESGFNEWLKPQMRIGGSASYGFGWFLQDWNGMKVVQHGGNIDGFNSLVAMIPEKKIGFVMLTNVSGSPLGDEMMPVVWANLLGDKRIPESEKLPFRAMVRLIGKYRLEATNQDVEVKIAGEDLVLSQPGQHEYKLKRTAPRVFDVVGAPAGSSIKFTPETDDATMLVLTEGGATKIALRVKADGTVVKPSPVVAPTGAAKELIGKYESEMSAAAVAEVAETNGKVTFKLPGQPPFELVEKAKDAYSLPPLPADAYTLNVVRDSAGKVTRLVVKQPEGEFGFKDLAYDGTPDKPAISVEELMQRTFDALGGELNIRKAQTRVTTFEMDLVHQGVLAHGTTWTKWPNKSATESTFTAIGKPIMLGYDYWDGTKGGEASTLGEPSNYTGKAVDDVRLANDQEADFKWKETYKTIEVKGIAKVGDEECYKVVFTPVNGTKFTNYFSTKTFYLLKREGVRVIATLGNIEIPYSILYSDYRTVDGITMPFRTTSNSIANGDIVVTVKEIKHNVAIDDKLFAPKTLKF